MLSSVVVLTTRVASRRIYPVRTAPVLQAAAARYFSNEGRHTASEKLFAVDAPDGDHDLQDLVRFTMISCLSFVAISLLSETTALIPSNISGVECRRNVANGPIVPSR